MRAIGLLAGTAENIGYDRNGGNRNASAKAHPHHAFHGPFLHGVERIHGPVDGHGKSEHCENHGVGDETGCLADAGDQTIGLLSMRSRDHRDGVGEQRHALYGAHGAGKAAPGTPDSAAEAPLQNRGHMNLLVDFTENADQWPTKMSSVWY